MQPLHSASWQGAWATKEVSRCSRCDGRQGACATRGASRCSIIAWDRPENKTRIHSGGVGSSASPKQRFDRLKISWFKIGTNCGVLPQLIIQYKVRTSPMTSNFALGLHSAISTRGSTPCVTIEHHYAREINPPSSCLTSGLKCLYWRSRSQWATWKRMSQSTVTHRTITTTQKSVQEYSGKS